MDTLGDLALLLWKAWVLATLGIFLYLLIKPQRRRE